MATLESIQARIAKLQAQAEALVTTKSSAALEKIRGLMEKHGISVADIETHLGKRPGRKPGKNAASPQQATAAKYRDPKSGALWSGRGRAPAWIANVKNRARFLIEGEAPAPVAKKAAKPGNYVRGPQPVMYRDPKTGATWSGRGRAPAWLAGAKDRKKFLIDGAAEITAELKAKAPKKSAASKSATKTAAVKKTAAKKVAAKKVAMKMSTPATEKAAMRKASVKKAPVKRAVVKKVASKEAIRNASVETSSQAVEAPNITASAEAQS